jgi:hypothetical protein
MGVDLDGTTFVYDGWTKWCDFGPPIPAMVERIRAWSAAGVRVRAITARIGLPVRQDPYTKNPIYSLSRVNACKMTGERFSDHDMHVAIMRHCGVHQVPIQGAQCYKDYNMIELWDDRAVQVVANTGLTLAEEHAAELAALRGKQFGGK